MYRNFILLLQGQVVSAVGTHLFVIVTLYWLMEASNSGSLMGLYMMVETLPAALLMPVGGLIADRFDRKRIIVYCDVFNGIAVLMLAALFYSEASQTLITAMLFVTAGMLGVSAGIFMPAVQSMVPDILPARSLAMGNSLIGMVFSVGEITGKALGGALFLAFGAPLLVLLDGLSYLVSAFTETFIRLPPKEQVARASESTAAEPVIAEMMQGIRYCLKTRGLRNYLALEFCIHASVGLIAINMPFFVRDFLARDADWYGYLMSAMAVGGVLGSLIAGARFNSRGILGRTSVVVCSILYFPLGCVLLALTRDVTQALILFFLFGLTMTTVMVVGMTLVQSAAPPAIRGRVIAAFSTVVITTFPVSTLIGGLLADALDKNIPVIIFIAAGMSLVLFVPLVMTRALREFLAMDIEQGKTSDGGHVPPE